MIIRSFVVMNNVMDVILIMQMMTVSISIWMHYVVQNSYLKAQRQVGIFIRGGMLIKIITIILGGMLIRQSRVHTFQI